ncbi:MAG: hypothetical protein IPO12_01890 [Flavobacteriales bacterium]|nr:hypothetical protein [Flavobacteriales bacterium]
MTLSVFINVGSYVDFDEAYDYHLTSNSIGSGMGVPVGTDVGIYDGPQGSPWKEDAIPFNPHWLSLSPSLGTSVGGVVNVNLSGEAQQD